MDRATEREGKILVSVKGRFPVRRERGLSEMGWGFV